MLVAISIGTIEIPLGKVITAVFAYFLPTGNQLDENIINIIGNIRLPRVLTGMVVGMGLGVSGAVMQTVLRNPYGHLHLHWASRQVQDWGQH